MSNLTKIYQILLGFPLHDLELIILQIISSSNLT